MYTVQHLFCLFSAVYQLLCLVHFNLYTNYFISQDMRTFSAMIPLCEPKCFYATSLLWFVFVVFLLSEILREWTQNTQKKQTGLNDRCKSYTIVINFRFFVYNEFTVVDYCNCTPSNCFAGILFLYWFTINFTNQWFFSHVNFWLII